MTNKAFAGLQINGVTEDAETGSLVASAGDINGDGIDDILIRSSNDEDGRLFDDVYIVYGTDTDFDATLDLDKLDAIQNLLFREKGGDQDERIDNDTQRKTRTGNQKCLGSHRHRLPSFLEFCFIFGPLGRPFGSVNDKGNPIS